MSNDCLDTLRALNATFIQNFVTNDAVAHDAIIHPRFTCLMPDGARLARGTYLKRWAAAFDPHEIVYWDYRDERIDVFGNVALVQSTNKYVRRADGDERMGMTVYTDTYLDTDGGWKCILAHLTPVAPAHYPDDDTIVRAWVNGEPVAD